jgi:hypothetical protein
MRIKVQKIVNLLEKLSSEELKELTEYFKDRDPGDDENV